jgi:hypothetical protein
MGMIDISMFERMTDADRHKAVRILGSVREPDFTIAPDGRPYLYRWHVIPRNDFANVYLHMQVASDPERPLHDHPWDNQTVVLSGGYAERVGHFHGAYAFTRHLRAGDVQARKAEEPHRLVLPDDIPYTLTLFTTGPKRRKWGFWFPDGWRESSKVIIDQPDGTSVFKGDA